MYTRFSDFHSMQAMQSVALTEVFPKRPFQAQFSVASIREWLKTIAACYLIGRMLVKLADATAMVRRTEWHVLCLLAMLSTLLLLLSTLTSLCV